MVEENLRMAVAVYLKNCINSPCRTTTDVELYTDSRLREVYYTLCFSILFFSFNQELAKIETISDDLFFSEIMDSTYLIIHKFPGKCNSMFVLVGNNKGVLIDTPNETTGTKSLLDWINTKFGDLELIAINTGFHNDNLGGNEYLRSKGIKIYGSGLTARLIGEQSDDLKAFILNYTSKQEDEKYKDAKIVIPGHGDWGDTKLLSHTIDILNKWNKENTSR